MARRTQQAGAIAAAGLMLAAGAYVVQAVAQPALPTDQQRRLIEAKRQSAAAQARSDRLERAAAAERDAAAKARAQEGAVAARIEQAEADIAASQARIAIVQTELDTQRGALAEKQAPIARLLAALQSLARRPAVVSVVQPGSVDDLVHVRAVLGTVMPAVRARTAGIRADLAQTRRLRANAALAMQGLNDGRARLDSEQLALARLEASHRDRSRMLGRGALAESDRAIALGESARDIVDQMEQLGNARATTAELASLPGPALRPPRPGETASSIDGLRWPAGAAPYRLPVAGQVETGLGEVSDSGVRSRGLTLAPAPGAAVVAPAAGRVAYARRFGRYGMIVILDHGGGWTSLVTGMAALAVRPGMTVAQGGVIGRAGSGDTPRVTVELRRKGRPIDMTPLLG